MNKLIIFILIYAVIIGTIVWFPPFYTNENFYNNIIFSVFPLVTSLLAISALRVVGTEGDRARSLLSISLGVFLWFVADFSWGIEQIARNGEITFPAIGDYFYLFGYMLFFMGLIQELRLANLSWKKINKRLLSIGAIISLIAIGLFTYNSIYLTYSPDATLWENIVTMGYGVGDILLIITSFFLILLAWEHRGGKISGIWVFLLLAFLMDIIADSLYATHTTNYLNNVNPVTNIVNLIYNAGYIFMAIYFYNIGTYIKELQEEAAKLAQKTPAEKKS